MASTKIVLRKKKLKDGSYPLAIRITKDRKSSFIHLGHHIKESEWDDLQQKVKPSHPNSKRLNNFIIKKLAEASDKLMELEGQNVDISAKKVQRTLKPKAGSSFFDQANDYFDNLKRNGKYNQISADYPRIKRFKEFLKGDDIQFSDITVALLKRFKSYLKSTRPIKERTIINHIVAIRSVFSLAISENAVDKKYYPFGKGGMSIKFPDSAKVGLTRKEIQRLEDLDLEPGSYLNHTRNIWLFSFYFAGMRISDILRLRWSDFQDDRLHYTMGKNHKGGSLKVPEKVKAILGGFEDAGKSSHGLIFPELKLIDFNDDYQVQLKISSAVNRLNKALKKLAGLAEIDKNLTLHIARHSFGNIAGDRIHPIMLQKLYRHSDLKTTINYQANFITKAADDALDIVVGS